MADRMTNSLYCVAIATSAQQRRCGTGWDASSWPLQLVTWEGDHGGTILFHIAAYCRDPL